VREQERARLTSAETRIADFLCKIQYEDWTTLRQLPEADSAYVRAIERLSQKAASALKRSIVSNENTKTRARTDRLSRLELLQNINAATRELAKLNQILEKISTEIIQKLQFDFINIQLVNKDAQTIETVYSQGLTREWFAIEKHTIHEDARLWDIQTAIAMHDPPRLEIISGHDRRFDPFIFKVFSHIDHVRVFVPIILAPSEVKLETLNWDVLDPLAPDVDQPSPDDRRTILEIRAEDWVGAKTLQSHVIGTIEAGFYDCSRRILPGVARQLATIAGQRAWDIYRASLENVLRTIARPPSPVKAG
jgi:hypothetical protein